AAAAGGAVGRELTRAEKEALLARIEQAARRVREGSKTVGRVEALLADGKLDEARASVARLEAREPGARSLAALKELVAAAEAREGREDAAQDGRRDEARAALARVREAADGGRLDEARAALKHAREVVAAGAGVGAATARAALDEMEARVSGLERTVERRARVDEAETMFERYLKKKQLSLARLALETLIDLAPTHPKRTDYEAWVEVLAEEVEEEKRADEALAAGREALTRGDFRLARRHLAALRKADEDRAAAFEGEVALAEREAEETADFEESRERFERLLAERRLEEAQQELRTLAEMGAAKVTVELYRSRLDEALESARDEAQLEAFLEAFRGRMEAGDFAGAREVAGELQRTSPDDPRPSELLAEVAQREREADRRRSIEQGEAQVERFIAAGDGAKAALALKVLVQMAPQHKKRKAFEKRIAKLATG
ncbi:MAG TPA: hypothetical protein VLF66_05900, partial [Thermoanaerobaculia bacterium]|nr:hypothetical protein [Thermoanaerobaculia bacterium]